ncbi:MAG: flagellar basal body rod protein FlgB [Acidimicrobiales bacterium]
MGLTINVLHYALDAIGHQEKVIANNVANDQTPGYTAKTYSFEASLRAALASGGTTTLTPTAGVSPAPPGTNANNVDLAGQMVALSKDNLATKAVVNGLDTQFHILSGSMGDGF